VSDKLDATNSQLHEKLRTSLGALAAEMGAKVVDIAKGSAADLSALRCVRVAPEVSRSVPRRVSMVETHLARPCMPGTRRRRP
jgi:hypothetical protein